MENENLQLGSSPMSQQESKVLKAHVSLLYDWKAFIIKLIIVFFTVITSLLIWTFSPRGSFLIIFAGLIWLLMPLSMLFLDRPNPIAVMSGKIILKRPMRKPVVVEKEDILQISEKKNDNHSLRWLSRLFYVIFISFYFIEWIIRDLKNLERSAPEYIDLSLFLLQLSIGTVFIVLYYNFELVAPYQRTLKVTTRSNLKLQFFTDDPEELKGLLKKEKE